MPKSKLAQITIALKKAIPVGKALDLENDTFLTNYLDGADKIYGFVHNEDGEIRVEHHGMMGPYPISDLDKGDIDYIFGLSAPNILKKIKGGKYKIVKIDEL